MARELVAVGKMGPAFSGEHERFSKIGSRFAFPHKGELAITVEGKVTEWWINMLPVPADILVTDMVKAQLGMGLCPCITCESER